MQIPGSVPWIAPLATGHPLSLPGGQKQMSVSAKVSAPTSPNNSDAAQTRDQPPFLFRRKTSVGLSPEGKNHAAPPTVMQMRIAQMLDEQAAKQADEAVQSEHEVGAASEHPVSVGDPEVAEKPEVDQPVIAPREAKKDDQDLETRMSRSAVFNTFP